MKLLFVCIIIFIPVLLFGTTLQDVYQSALPGIGYDRLITLNKDSVYTGGITVNNESVGIKGNGALINLNGDSISVIGNAVFEIDACIILNGNSGISLTGDAVGLITHCTFYGNQYGIHCDGHTGKIEVINTIISNSSRYGIATCEETATTLHYIDMYQNLLGDYVHWCPG